MTDVKRYLSPYQKPSAYQRELLTILIEECAEVTQRATKMLRFGTYEVQPGQELTNKERLSHEVGDLKCMIDMAVSAGLISEQAMLDGYSRKVLQLIRFMQTDPSQGAKADEGVK